VTGPLSGVRVVELAGLAPGPFGCMMLADLGADVVRIDRPGGARPDRLNGLTTGPLQRSRRSVALDLKSPAGVADLMRLLEVADVLVEGFRPGVAERLGIGPQPCQTRNPRLVYARITGWGQDGPMAGAAGHDINYIAAAGALAPFGHDQEPPRPPLNLIADFGGGGMLLTVGVLAALLERERSGRGQVVDTAMVNGSALLTAGLRGMIDAGLWPEPPGRNLLDGGAPFYRSYRTADGGFMAVGALEPAFYRNLLTGLDLAGDDLPPQYDRAGWPELRSRFTARFAERSRAAWTETFTDLDACVTPVLSPGEAPGHPQTCFVAVGDETQPAPAPGFSRTPAAPPRPAPNASITADTVLADWKPI
jgi:alpha-methylacyl-CoA racemase